MSRIIAILLLLLHVNYSMFIPVMDEVDSYNACGVQVDDINSTCEYIDQIVLGNEDDSPEDEDDDQAHYFNSMHAVQEYTLPGTAMPHPPKAAVAFQWIEKPGFMLRPENGWTSVVHDIVVPPPKA